MAVLRRREAQFFLRMGGCLLPSLFFCAVLWADTLTLKNGKDLKGLVVEQHEDRIIFSTVKGEIPILRSGIKNIQYDDPERNFMQVGKSYEEANKLEEALAYYEKALEINPDFEEAKKAAAGIRNRFWARTTAGPRDEMEKKQAIYDTWDQGKLADTAVKKKPAEQTHALRESPGVVLEKKGDWVYFAQVYSGKTAALAGLKKSDRLVAIDGHSLRYLGVDAVAGKLLLPHYSNFILEFERDCVVQKTGDGKGSEHLGLKLKLDYEGILVEKIEPDSPAEHGGLREQDFLVKMEGVSLRYLPLKKAMEIIQKTKQGALHFTVRRAVLLERK